MKIRKELTELVQAGLINEETAGRIQEYYNTKAGPPQNKLLVVFGILGAILVSLGIILILAHNWDDLNRGTKTVIAFIPMLVGQALCAYTLFRRPDSVTWRESASAFLFISIGACISLIGQVYNVPGSLSGYLMTWMLLGLPLVYIMKSSASSILYIIGITIYACSTGYWNEEGFVTYYYWGLLLLILPHYYLLYRNQHEGNFFTFHNWFIPLSVIIALGTLARDFEEFMFVAYVSLFGLFYIIGNFAFLKEGKIRNNGYLVLGAAGTVAIMLALSFDWFWQDLRSSEVLMNEVTHSLEFIVTCVITVLALVMLFLQKRNQTPPDYRLMEFVFLGFIVIFFIGFTSPMAALLINVLLLTIGINTIREGAKRDHLGILNYGLLIVTALVICRFFDTELSFIIRGILFVAVGFGFFFANYATIKKRKTRQDGAPAIPESK